MRNTQRCKPCTAVHPFAFRVLSCWHSIHLFFHRADSATLYGMMHTQPCTLLDYAVIYYTDHSARSQPFSYLRRFHEVLRCRVAGDKRCFSPPTTQQCFRDCHMDFNNTWRPLCWSLRPSSRQQNLIHRLHNSVLRMAIYITRGTAVRMHPVPVSSE